jgi:hypothetical protein
LFHPLEGFLSSAIRSTKTLLVSIFLFLMAGQTRAARFRGGLISGETDEFDPDTDGDFEGPNPFDEPEPEGGQK